MRRSRGEDFERVLLYLATDILADPFAARVAARNEIFAGCTVLSSNSKIRSTPSGGRNDDRICFVSRPRRLDFVLTSRNDRPRRRSEPT